MAASSVANPNSDEYILAKEQQILETYFQGLGQFSYDKAKETVERERDAIHKSHQTTAVYSSLLTALSQLSSAERNYTSLMFFFPKGFLRKDSSLKAMYEVLKTEFTRLDDRSKGSPSPVSGPSKPSPLHPASLPNLQTPTFVSFINKVSSSQSNSSLDIGINRGQKQIFDVLDKLAGHICSHLLHFVTSRLETMDFYDKLQSLTSTRFIKYEELLVSLNDIGARYQKYFHHPLLTPLKTMFNFECEILQKLLEAQIQLQQWQFLPSLLPLHEAHSKLAAWAASSFAKETRRPYTVIIRQTTVPPLYQWLVKLKALLVSKFTLYFHEILSQQTTPYDMKNLCNSKSSDNLFQNIHSRILLFQRRTEANYIALVLETMGLDNYKGSGYHHPDKYFESPKGLDSYPAILSLPNEKPIAHWPNVIMIINDRSRELNNTDNVVYFHDKQVHTTYYVIKIEPRITLLALFESKKPERDNSVCYFLQETCYNLRCNKLFALLKPGNK